MDIIYVVGVILLISIYLFSKNKQAKKYLQGIPEPPANPVLGHITEIVSIEDIKDGIYRLLRSGKTVKVRFGPAICPIRYGLVSMDYKFIEFILSSNTILKKSENYVFLKPWLGNGLLNSDGEYWRRHRKILTPAFHFDILKDYVEVFERVGNILIEKLGHYDGFNSVDLYPLLNLCTLDIICESAMGVKLNVQSGENSNYVKCVTEMCRISFGRLISAWKFLKFTYFFSKDYFTERRILKILHGFTKDVLDTKIKNKTSLESKRMAFLDLLLKFAKDENVLTYDEILQEVDTFMFEGHDTTASGIPFVLYCLAQNPEVQEKVLQEQRDLFGEEKNPIITYSDLSNMKYLKYVIKETFRLYPPVPSYGRCTTEDVQFGNCLIPKDTQIFLFIYGLHRDPECFPEPERFIPERFSTIGNSKPYAYVPFSAGSRNCIGQRFAMFEVKSLVSKVIRHFELKPATPRHEVDVAFEVTLKSLNGVKVALKKRI